jgi:hypothetical protein|tara:strand:+ start:1 stop:894 length:894 start_codon:yes stop_codon:yes gene_type:complete
MSTVIVVASDLHCGSTLGLCPAEGVELDDGGWYKPSKAQKWLWQEWEKHWKKVEDIVRDRTWHLVLNGDLIDGFHHNSVELATPLTSIQIRMGMASLNKCLYLSPKASAIHVMRGTPAHVGQSASSEESMARALAKEGWPVVPDPDTGNYSSYKRRLDIGSTRISIHHHSRFGQRAHTRRSLSSLYAFDTWAETAIECLREMKNGDLQKAWDEKRPPDLAIRSHNHQYLDTGYDHRGVTRIVHTPAFQFATEWVHKIATNNLADVGILVIIVEDDGSIEVRPLLSSVSRTTPIKGEV